MGNDIQQVCNICENEEKRIAVTIKTINVCHACLGFIASLAESSRNTRAKELLLQVEYLIKDSARINIYDKNGKWIGQDYQRGNGDWSHKWKSTHHEGLDRFSWRGRAKGEDMKTWSYSPSSENNL